MEQQQGTQEVRRGYFEQLDVRFNQVDETAVNAYVLKVFGWMFFGLLITTLSTMGIIIGINSSPAFVEFINTAFNFVLIIFIAQVILVSVISARVTKMNPFTAKFLYVLYAASNGLTVGLVSVLFAAEIGGMGIIGAAFGITTVSFGVMALYGYFTGKDLTRFSSLLRMALFGLILVMVVNWFLGSDMMGYIISVVGLFIFLGLVAADTNKIKNHFAQVALGSSDETNQAMGVRVDQAALASNLAIVGALMLYLDFINIFMFVLRLLGRRR